MAYKKYTKVTNRMYKYLENGKLYGVSVDDAVKLNLKTCERVSHEKSEYDIFLGYKYIIPEKSLKKALSQSSEKFKELTLPEVTESDVDKILTNFKQFNQNISIRKRVRSVYWKSKNAEREQKHLEFEEKMKNPAYAKAVMRNTNKAKWAENHRIEHLNEMTPSEIKVWNYIKNSKLKNYGFEPQINFEISGHIYFGDFVSKRHRIVIEVDGGYHSTKTTQIKDDQKNKDLDFFGYSVFRIKNEEVEDIENLHALRKRIKERVHQSSLQKYHNNVQDEYKIDATNVIYNNAHGKETGEIREDKNKKYWTKDELNDFFCKEEIRLINEGYLKPRR